MSDNNENNKNTNLNTDTNTDTSTNLNSNTNTDTDTHVDAEENSPQHLPTTTTTPPSPPPTSPLLPPPRPGRASRPTIVVRGFGPPGLTAPASPPRNAVPPWGSMYIKRPLHPLDVPGSAPPKPPSPLGWHKYERVRQGRSNHDPPELDRRRHVLPPGGVFRSPSPSPSPAPSEEGEEEEKEEKKEEEKEK